MLNIDHASKMRLRAQCLRLQCQIDNAAPTKIAKLLQCKLRNMQPDREIWTGRLIATITEVAIFARRTRRAIKREWLYRLMLDASSFIPAVASAGKLPRSILMLPGVKSSGLKVSVIKDTLEDQCHWLLIPLFNALK